MKFSLILGSAIQREASAKHHFSCPATSVSIQSKAAVIKEKISLPNNFFFLFKKYLCYSV